MTNPEAACQFTRRRRDRDPRSVPLAFSFEGSLAGPAHEVTVVRWSDPAAATLRDLGQHLRERRPRRELPVASLRGRLEVADRANLRIDRDLGLWGTLPALLWTATAPAAASEAAGMAALGWLVDDIAPEDDAARAAVRRLKDMARGRELLAAARREASVFSWAAAPASGTARPGPENATGFADLADFVARRLEGQEVLAGLGPLRRVAGGYLDANQAELITGPVPGGAFSLVLRVRVLTFPGRATPLVTLELSRRGWARGFRRTASRELSAYALPEAGGTALRFTLRRQRAAEGGHTYQPDGDFAPIARAFGLRLDLTGAEIAAEGHRLPGCPLLVVHKHGTAERSATKQGVPDRDKMEAYRRAGALLAPCGLRPWSGLREVPSATRPTKGREQRWRDRDDDAHRGRFERWRERELARLGACYPGSHRVVVGYHPACRDDAEQVARTLGEVLAGRVQVQLIPIPHDVHGPRAALPAPALPAPAASDIADLRARAWGPFVSEVRRYQADAAGRIDGVLIVAPEWYGATHDDPVNKRAGRIALARELRVPNQYLRPRREEGQRFRADQDPGELFETRTMMAWLDLAWRSVGGVDGARLAEIAADIYGEGAGAGAGRRGADPPDRVLAIGVLRRNRTRLANEPSFVPFAIELDVASGTCTARFAREDGPRMEITAALPLQEAVAELAASGPIRLAPEQAGRQRELQARAQRFFHEAITDSCRRARRPLVLIDAVACRGVWPWVADDKLDGGNVLLDGQLHAEAEWGDVRIVRVRTGNAPKVLLDGYYEGRCAATGEVLRYDAPVWAEAQLYALSDARAPVFLSFGSLLQTGLIRGASCYRDIDGLGKIAGARALYRRGPIRVFTGAWSTPMAVELTVARAAEGESPEQLARFVERLRTLHLHTGDWTAKPAPLYFETTLKQYLADYDLDEEGEEEEVEA